MEKITEIKQQKTISIKETFDFLYLNEQLLSLNQIEFVRGLQKYYTKHKELSEKQQKALFEIRKYLNVGETIRMSNNIK